ncbi:hypothetical protein WPS_01060 [Vulcanimicrobium alpinum]|uniref:Flavin-nucleotide-binding protein n=1 Tax=Vulcanimicrobium alpinum TaxID=3016050 RepID=A0AAN2C7A7_UNVUL|nr:pyridoxamine 5'-phosphate oxidase family protein [Vulcanimicrobium alpinum]BDE04830.1 hypothetical protein WPS_01060 [Vulcanimicrobium alpinum]
MPNTQIVRHPERAAYDRSTVDAILDAAYIAHLGAIVDGAPVVLPYVCARIGDELVLHGSRLAGTLTVIAQGTPVCTTVTHVDGLVLARSAFHTSMNYRCAVVHERARLVDDPAEKARMLDAMFERILPGPATQVRAMTDGEREATCVIALPLDAASAKVRIGGAIEPAADGDPSVWAGVVPLALRAGTPQPDAVTGADAPPPQLR